MVRSKVGHTVMRFNLKVRLNPQTRVIEARLVDPAPTQLGRHRTLDAEYFGQNQHLPTDLALFGMSVARSRVLLPFLYRLLVRNNENRAFQTLRAARTVR